MPCSVIGQKVSDIKPSIAYMGRREETHSRPGPYWAYLFISDIFFASVQIQYVYGLLTLK